MTIIRIYGSFVSFTLPLEDHGHVNVLENLLVLRFKLQIGTMYMKQEMYFVDCDISKTI